MGAKITLIIFSIFFLATTSAAAEYSIDISGLTQEEYNIGGEITFKIILLEDGSQIEEQVNYQITDTLGRKEINGTTTSNQETSIGIENDFPSGIWTIRANYLDTQVERTFLVGENSEVVFSIEGDELIIQNTGNVRYTKTIQITIGDSVNSYTQNIKTGDKKILKLISINGEYDIEVTDGKTTIKRENVQLFGTGNVVGAIDKNLIGYTGFAGAEDVGKAEDKEISLSKLPLSMIFITAVGILTALVFVERKISKRKQ